MPKKETASAVLDMLSSTGARTRPPGDRSAPERPAVTPESSAAPPAPPAAPVEEPAAPPVPLTRRTVAEVADAAADAVPRTLRLRPGTAGELREAWLVAKREDVLLTAQDFASELIEEALAARTRGRRRRPS